MRVVSCALVLFLSHCLSVEHSDGSHHQPSEEELWRVIEDDDSHFPATALAIRTLQHLLSTSHSTRGQDDKYRFDKAMKHFTLQVKAELKKGEEFIEKGLLANASDTYYHLLQHAGELMDDASVRMCNARLGHALFRQALVGNVSWQVLDDHYSNMSSTTGLGNLNSIEYSLSMAHANVVNKAVEESGIDPIMVMQPVPYVLRFSMPQYAQTPSIGHFGHAVLDGLWPFARAYALGSFQRCREGASIYVLDIGLYILPLLRTVFPSIDFHPFHSLSSLPLKYETVDLHGPGMVRFQELPDITDDNPFHYAPVVRKVVFDQLGLKPQGQCVVLLSRSVSSAHLASFHAKHRLDMSREAPGLRQFHWTGDAVYTAMHYSPTTAQERRAISNEQSLFRHIVRIFNRKFGACVQLVQLDKLSVRDQVEVFAKARMVVAQHGAGLSLAPFMPSDGVVLELVPHINPNFQLACVAAGVKHVFVDLQEYREIYSAGDGRFIEVSEKGLLRLMAQHLQGWTPPILGKVYNGTAEPSLETSSVPSAGFSSTVTCSASEAPTSLLVIPEVAYIEIMLKKHIPFLWVDSGFEGISEEDGGSNPWARRGRTEWEASMRRVVYDQGIDVPQKIMASPTNVFDFYDTFVYDVINLNPGEYSPAIAVNKESLDDYSRRYGPFSKHSLAFVHFGNRTVVSGIPSFQAVQRQVQGPPNVPYIGFRLMDHSVNLRHKQPIVASGESYYMRISADEGTPFYDLYAPFIMPAAFNKYRSFDFSGEIAHTPGGYADPTYKPGKYSYGSPRRRHNIVSNVNRVSVFFSEKHAFTNLHYDQVGEGAVVCQLKGSKRVQLWPPGNENMNVFVPKSHPHSRRSAFNGRNPQASSHLLAMRKAYDLTVEEGMCVYIPAMWWHCVESLDNDTISVRFSI